MALVHEPDLRAGQWLVERLGPLGARVGSLVPAGFDAYARVLHPARSADGAPARWADVAEACGTRLHPAAQLWRLVGAPDPWRADDGRWSGGTPAIGTLDAATLTAVVEALATHRGSDAGVVAALWDGFGWIDGGGVTALWTMDGDLSSQERATAQAQMADRNALLARGAFSPDVLSAPRLSFPHRDYILFRGSLADVTSVLDPTGPWSTPGIGSWDQTPNLLWPDDQSWCLATEIDLDSTVIGGPARLIDAVLGHPDLDAMRLPPEASLAADGDTEN